MEQAVTFQCATSSLIGIVHKPEKHISTAVLIVVGGPQYRVGSHRQFVQLSRHVAHHEIASMRFDYTGMGDSTGEKRNFDEINDDIKVAIDTLLHVTKCEKVVIWGLCDAASAAIMYANNDHRVTGLVLLNPWLKNSAAMGKAMVKHYYLKLLISKAFWRKLLSGKVNVKASLGDVGGHINESLKGASSEVEGYQLRMKAATESMKATCCLLVSGIDLTAKEFLAQTESDKVWKRWLKKTKVIAFKDADHTFSNKEAKQQVAAATTEFVLSVHNSKRV